MIEIREVDRVHDEETDVHFSFEYIDRFDPIDLRARLGLDGVEGKILTPQEKGQIATRLYRNGYLTEEEIILLHGRILERET